MIKIARALKNTSTLTCFNISGNNINGATDDIGIVLKHNKDLKMFSLSRCNLQTANAIIIAKALQSTFSLTVLNISNNNIGVEAAEVIAVALSNNTRLEKVYLNCNNLCTAGTWCA